MVWDPCIIFKHEKYGPKASRLQEEQNKRRRKGKHRKLIRNCLESISAWALFSNSLYNFLSSISLPKYQSKPQHEIISFLRHIHGWCKHTKLSAAECFGTRTIAFVCRTTIFTFMRISQTSSEHTGTSYTYNTEHGLCFHCDATRFHANFTITILRVMVAMFQQLQTVALMQPLRMRATQTLRSPWWPAHKFYWFNRAKLQVMDFCMEQGKKRSFHWRNGAAAECLDEERCTGKHHRHDFI